MTEQMSYANVADLLVERLPIFSPIYEEHVRDYNELLPHLLWGDLTRFILRAWRAGEHDTVATALAFLEEMIQANDAEVRNLVKDSFVENCGPIDHLPRDFIRTWPAHLKAEADKQWGTSS